MWRLLQCVRCYVDTFHMTHVANAFKYATGIIVVFASTNKRSGGSSVLFWASVLLNSLYSFYWDIRMDWGLFTSTRTIIRENRRYDKVWYYVAVALDFVLRISWSLKLSASYGLLFDGEYSSLLSQVLELFRRTMWTCIRVEYVLSLSLSLPVTFIISTSKMKQIRGRSKEEL